MTTQFLSRTAWTKTSAEGSRFSRTPRGVAVHWPGANTPFRGRTQAQVAALLEGWRRMHTSSPRNWADIAYQVAIDASGRVWDLRGIDRKSAANGDSTTNGQYGAVVLLLGPGEDVTPAMAEAFREWRDTRWLRRWPGSEVVTTHQAVRPKPTACPGSAAIRFVQTRGWTDVTAGPPPAPPAPARPRPPLLPTTEAIVRELPNLSRALRSNGFHVRLLEGALAANRHVLRDPNGNFGPDTEAQVKQFQAARGMPATGVVDRATWQRLLQL